MLFQFGLGLALFSLISIDYRSIHYWCISNDALVVRLFQLLVFILWVLGVRHHLRQGLHRIKDVTNRLLLHRYSILLAYWLHSEHVYHVFHSFFQVMHNFELCLNQLDQMLPTWLKAVLHLLHLWLNMLFKRQTTINAALMWAGLKAWLKTGNLCFYRATRVHALFLRLYRWFLPLHLRLFDVSGIKIFVEVCVIRLSHLYHNFLFNYRNRVILYVTLRVDRFIRQETHRFLGYADRREGWI